MPSNDKPGNDELQFDRVSASGESAAPRDAIVCAACAAAVRTWYYDVDGAPHCAGCKQKVERSNGPVRDWGLTFRAGAFGFGAAIAGAIIYYGVIAITNFEIGIVALLIGWMVGFSIRKGANGRGGRRLQVAGAALTYFAVALAYMPLVIKGAAEKAKVATQESAVSADSTQESSAEPNAVADPDAALLSTPAADAKVHPIFAVGALVALTFALPVMVVFGTLPSGLISALIIGIGMRQAWTMTRASDMTIGGPFKVGRSRSGATQAA
ncbi:MAG: hypothetical protein ACT4P6_08605 [Gemmatimonadaceae bacterium]